MQSQAVEEEDYDEAARLKQSIDRMKGQIQAQIDAIEHGNFARFQNAPQQGSMPPQHHPPGYPPQMEQPPQNYGYPPYQAGMPSGPPPSHSGQYGAPQQSTSPYSGGSPGRQQNWDDYQGSSHGGTASHYQAQGGYGDYNAGPGYSEYENEHEGAVSPHSGYAQPAVTNPTGDPHLDKPLPGAAQGGGPEFYEKAATGAIPAERPQSRQLQPATEKYVEQAIQQESETGEAKGSSGGEVGAETEKADPSQLEGVEGVEELPAPEPIPSNEHADATPLIDVFGEYVVRCLFSKVSFVLEINFLNICLSTV